MTTDLEFAVDFAGRAGLHMLSVRSGVRSTFKFDRTVVTDADREINDWLIREVAQRSGGHATVLGEEASVRVANARDVWVIDPIDGTGEYVDPTVPMDQRTSCVGIALIRDGVLVLSVVYNPFRDEMFIATADSPTLRNGTPVSCSTQQLSRGVPYDYCHWDDAAFDARKLERWLGQPLGTYSAIYQACLVASGRSALAFFPGGTIHDIAPAALLVARAGGVVSDVYGNPLQWDNLTRGVVYASRASHAQAVALLLAR